MHINAYGLTKAEREQIVQMAKSGLHYERYLAEKFHVTDKAIRNICAQMGNYVCKKIDKTGQHCDGHEI